jgi:uncharacterized protein YbjT (DUF2867 family)
MLWSPVHRLLREGSIVKILVIGGTGLIGSQVIANLTQLGHEAVSASPRSGVNSVTGEGLAEAVAGVHTVVDVSNSPSFDDDPVMQFFTTSTKNLLAAERDAGVQHHVALSIVGADRAPDSGYMRAKVAQEKLIEESGNPYSIVRATQFFEFLGAIADSATDGNTVRLPEGAFQPIAAKDVATAVSGATISDPTNGITNIAGPEKRGMADFIRSALAEAGDPRQVVGDPAAQYFGTLLDDHTIVPLDSENPTIYPTRFSEWAAARQSSGAQ